MSNVFGTGIVLGVAGGVAYGMYLLCRFVAGQIVKHELAMLEVAPDRQRLKVKFRDWFQWNVSVNAAKGTAGGTIKLDFPIESGLVLCLLCLAIATYGRHVTQYVIPTIFLCFAFYHLRRWVLSLRALKRLKESWAAVHATPVTGNELAVRDVQEVRARVEFTLSHCLRDAWHAFWSAPIHMTAAAAVASLVSVLTLFIGHGAAFGGLHRAAHDAIARRRPVSAITVFWGFTRFLRLAHLLLLQVVCIGALGLLGGVPGVMLATLWMYGIHFVVDEDLEVVDALRASFELVKPRFFSNLAVLVFATTVTATGYAVPGVAFVFGPACMGFAYLFASAAFLRQVSERRLAATPAEVRINVAGAA